MKSVQRAGCLTILTAIASILSGCAPAGSRNEAAAASSHRDETSSVAKPVAPGPQPPAPSADTAPDTRPVIVCFGDSITAGYGVDLAANYPAVLQHDLDAKGYRYRVLNMGISGETTKDGLLRVSAVLARKPAVVVVEFGGNDGLRGLPLSDTQRNLTEIVTGLRRGGAAVLVAAISLPTQYGPDYINRFNAIFPAVAKQSHVPLLPFVGFSKGVYGVEGNVQDDGIHPTASGDRVLAANVAAALTPLLQRPR